MQECMFCQRLGDDETINIFEPYDNNNRKVIDDMNTFLEHSVELYLHQTDRVCYGCKKVLANIAKLKDRLWRFISLYRSNPNLKPDPIHLCKLDNVYNSYVRSDDEDSTDVELVEELYSTPYKPQFEKYLEENQREASLSRASYLSQYTNADNHSATPKPKRKRRKRSHSTASYKRKQKTPEPGIHRPRSSRSASSLVYRKSLYDEHGNFINKITRSKKLDEDNNCSSDEEDKVYYCGIGDCTLYFVEIDNLTIHKTMHHDQYALYFCDECDEKYTDRKYLDIHSRVHDTVSLFCFMCGSEHRTRKKLQKHFDLHMKTSVPCPYCEKLFVSESDYRDHVKKDHNTGIKQKIRKKFRGRTFIRIDKDNENSVVEDSLSDEDDWTSSTKNNFRVINLDDRFSLPPYED